MQHKRAEYLEQIENSIDKYTSSPTSQLNAEGIGFSPATVCRYLKVMREKNTLDYSDIRNITNRRQKEIRDTSSLVPFLGSVFYGALKFVEENIEEYVHLPVFLFGKGYVLIHKTNGDSIVEAGIDSGDLVLIRQTNAAESGQIVVAHMDDEVARSSTTLNPKMDEFVCIRKTVRCVTSMSKTALFRK